MSKIEAPPIHRWAGLGWEVLTAPGRTVELHGIHHTRPDTARAVAAALVEAAAVAELPDPLESAP